MKKLLTVVMAMILVTSFFGCKEQKVVTNNKIQIVATIFPLYDFVRAVAGDKADVDLLLPCGADAHSYEPTVQDVISVQESEFFVMLGKDAEPWAEGVTENLSGDKVFSAMDEVTLTEHFHEGHSFFEYDQHIWTSIKNSKKIVKSIANHLSEIDNENSNYYQKNADEYIKRMDDLDKKFNDLTANSEKTLVFADRFPFEYFTKDYSLQYFAAFPGCSEESEPSAASVTKLMETVENENVKVIFYTETSNGKLPDAVCENTGAEKRLLHSCHSVTQEELRLGKTYLDIMEENYESIKYYFEK